MSLEARMISLAQAVGADVKSLTTKQGDLTGLSTAAKTSLVAAINELVSGVASAGPGSYTNAAATPSTLGGIASGSTFANKTWQQMMDALLYPYQTPSFTTLAITGQSSPVEVGSSIAANPTFTWATANATNISANTIQITDVTNANAVLVSGSANDGTQAVTLATITKSTATSHTFRITGTNTNTATFTRDLTIAWQWKRYYGESASASLNETGIEALRVGGIVSGFAGTYSFSAGGYKYLSYPTALGTATSFKDQSTNLDVPFEAATTVSVTNTYGVTTTYNVHRTTNVLGSAINIIVA